MAMQKREQQNNIKTYISLFSSAGIGCFGFKQAGFECIATNEIIERRLNIQKANQKCKYESGYLCGDITNNETKALLYGEIARWEKQERISGVDVIIATPPCQGMSVANHKKSSTEIVRNSLVIESIKIIKSVQPKIFIFENVPAFMSTLCTDIDGRDKPISDAINSNLGSDYSYYSRVINFKNYGASSSRSRTIVIGVLKKYSDDISPLELFPRMVEEKTLREVIGKYPSLTTMGEISHNDIFHAFRAYPEHMRAWIHDLKEGESAFDNEDDEKKPHQIIDGKIVLNVRKQADKYKRQFWDKVGPCVHTRNDQLASQNTVHPQDDRVFSIRELMAMMTIPDSFRWTNHSLQELNSLSEQEKKAYLKKYEIVIRQSLGEAVPTRIFYEIATSIRKSLDKNFVSKSEIEKLVNEYNFSTYKEIADFINGNPLNLSISALSRIAELANTKRTDDAAFYTNKALITEMVKNLPECNQETIHVLEPSAGVGNFIPIIAKRYEGKKIIFDLVDIDADSLKLADILLKKQELPIGCKINYIVDDFLTHNFDRKYDFVIGNPPFYKMAASQRRLKEYRQNAINKETTNICSFFLDKIIDMANYVSIVFPKFLLNTPEFKVTRSYLAKKNIESITDFGEHGFPGVLIETIAININNFGKPGFTTIKSVDKNLVLRQRQSYICDDAFPYWIIYRNEQFDRVEQKLVFDCFTVVRDRQIVNSMLQKQGDIRIIKSRNIDDNGQHIVDIPGYDAYISEKTAKELSIYQYLDNDNVYLTPNMTYYPRVMRKPSGVLVNGSVAILIPRDGVKVSQKQMKYFSSQEYRQFYQIARNYQTRSLNVDACSVYFYGLLKEEV